MNKKELAAWYFLGTLANKVKETNITLEEFKKAYIYSDVLLYKHKRVGYYGWLDIDNTAYAAASDYLAPEDIITMKDYDKFMVEETQYVQELILELTEIPYTPVEVLKFIESLLDG